MGYFGLHDDNENKFVPGGALPRFEPIVEPTTEAARQIANNLLAEWWRFFVAKNTAYGEYDRELGARGEFVEIWRKAKLLKKTIWHDEVAPDLAIGPASETPREVVMDMIGHLFLMLYVMDGWPSGEPNT